MVRQAHHHITLSQVEGQITMTEITNPKQAESRAKFVIVSSRLESRSHSGNTKP
jgi:hypothetical protein